MKKQFNNFKLHTDTNNILWLAVDRANVSVNSLSRDVFDELNIILDDIAVCKLAGVVILSGKKKGFIAGADISQFTHLKTKKEAFELIRQAQLVLDKLAALPMPTLAMIKGFCLGGGLELALACRYRVAADTDDTKIGLPEIKLGIHPGWGGTVRLPNLIGVIESMKMILPGAAYHAKKCAKLGIVDCAVPERMLERAARSIILAQPKPHSPHFLAKICAISFIRPLLGKLFYKNLSAKKVNKKHYPAPFAVVRNWIKEGAKGNAMVNEANSIAELMITETARNLVRIFFLQEKMKGIAKQIPFKAKWVHVIGAGIMGGDIAAWCALQGFKVTLQDQSPEKIAPAIQRAYQLFDGKLKVPRLIQAAMDRLQADQEGSGLARADVIIEAVFENLSVKQAIFTNAESKAKPNAILATNTSSIPLEEIATALRNPNRLVGIHFFNPVDKMPLVEIVFGEHTADETAFQAAAFVGQISRLPLPVASRPGFLVNRVLMPYLMEAMTMLEEGIPAAVIDQAAVRFGMPMGPITLADKVGLDICLSVAQNLSQYFDVTMPERLRTMVSAGHLGVKSGEGFYRYHKGKPINVKKVDPTSIPSDISDRMIFRMLNEAVACLSEKVVADSDLLDAGMIFGTGFAPFLGGPIQYARTRGIKTVVARLDEFAKRFGDRFKPHQAGWQKLLSDNLHLD
ncbi:MAG: crotonase [Gammaproteobacteria bacterium RIFCSPHIGHO2_02_FULL_39_13]|nr:MAG: crotonase [Gammaproteobacteria bacterium RIFCSPHIGHO2_02_FULL_39_13]OGT50167.1 MAG: crotonase [Gammaproteobacteria bacterium RIFCSPHIGHO2_12_FULL_39_24]